MATKAYFGFPRRTDDFTLIGTWLATYPLSNLLYDASLRPLTRVARSLDASPVNTSLAASASAPVACSGVALIGHNCSQSAQIRLRTWSDTAFSTPAGDTGPINLWPAGYTAAELEGAMWIWNYRFADPNSLTIGGLQIDITDASNADGYIQAGALEIYQAFDVAYNFNFGSQWGFEWRSQVAAAIGGAEVFDRRTHPRLFKGNFEFTTHADALGKFYEMWRQLRFDQPVMFVPKPDEVTYFNKLHMFARQMDPGLASYRARTSAGLIHSVPVALREVIG